MAKDVAENKADDEERVEGDGAEGEVGGKKTPPLMLIIIGAVALVLVLGGGAAAYLLFLAPHKPPTSAADKAHKPKQDAKKGGEKKWTWASETQRSPQGVCIRSTRRG